MYVAGENSKVTLLFEHPSYTCVTFYTILLQIEFDTATMTTFRLTTFRKYHKGSMPVAGVKNSFSTCPKCFYPRCTEA